MSTTTRVLRSFTGCSVTPPNANAIAVVSIMEWRINDATQELRTISDNDTAYKKFNQAYEFTGSVRAEDPIQLEAVRGKGGCNVAFTAVDLNGVGNVNVLMTGLRFAQTGLAAPSGQQGVGEMSVSGGAVTYTAA
jgi:hypothetical protein